MLRLLLLLLYLAASYASTPSHLRGNLTGNLDPDGRSVQPRGDLTANLDPNG